jgi:hypothetical protein
MNGEHFFWIIGLMKILFWLTVNATDQAVLSMMYDILYDVQIKKNFNPSSSACNEGRN